MKSGPLSTLDFNNLDDVTTKKFRKNLSNQLGLALSALSKEDESIRSTKTWEILQGIKGEIYAGSKSLKELLQESNGIKLDVTESQAPKVKTLLSNLGGILADKKYESIIKKDLEEKPAKAISSSSLGLFASASSDNLLKKYLQKLISDNATEKNKSLLVKALMKLAAPKEFNGVLLDMDEVMKNVSTAGLEGLGRDAKILEMDARINRCLGQKIDEIINNAKAKNMDRVQIILKSTDHYTPCDIDIKNRSCLVFDAVSDMSREKLLRVAKVSQHIDGDKVIDAQMGQLLTSDGKTKINEGLQKDTFSCWAFALHQSFEIAKSKDIHDNMLNKSTKDEAKNIRKVAWVDFPPAVIVIAQTTRFLDAYNSHNPQHAADINRMTDSNAAGKGLKHVLDKFSATIARTHESELTQFVGENEANNLSIKLK